METRGTKFVADRAFGGNNSPMIPICPPLLLRAFAGCLCVGFAWGQIQQLPGAEFERVRGGKLKVDLEVGDARVSISAGGFYQSQTADGAVRELFATQFRSTVSGAAKTNFRTIPLGEAEDSNWLESVTVNGEFDQLTEVTIKPDELELDLPVGESESAARLAEDQRLRRAAAASPIRIRIFSDGGAEPRCEIEIGYALETGGPGIEISSNRASKITETRSHRTLRQGVAVETPSPPQTRELAFHPQLRIGVSSSDPGLQHNQQMPPPLVFDDFQTRPVQMLSKNRIAFSGAASTVSRPREDSNVSGGFGDTVVRASWDFTAGEPLDLGWLEAAASDAETWLPTVGAQRHFTAHLKNPSGVEGVRFLLENVSNHPGIAINAGEAAANPAVRKVAYAPVKVTAGAIGWTRYYQTYEPTAADALPDLFFEAVRNPGFQLQGVDQLITTAVSSKVTANVTVNDFAASGDIRAQVLVDGFWEDLAARGPGVLADKISLHLPLDSDGDGIADAFGLAAPVADDDGDGLTRFEEYRGVYVSGTHLRLQPDRFDAFIFDYAGKTNKSLRDRLELDSVTLHWIDSSEHRGEAVGGSKIVVLEDLNENALLTLVTAERAEDAWRALAPSPAFRTIFLNGVVDQQLLAEDLKQVLAPQPEN